MRADVQPRYAAYCRAHGRDPDAMLERDRARYPGGAMAGYVAWISERWQEWRAETGEYGPATGEVARRFDRWLDEPARRAS